LLKIKNQELLLKNFSYKMVFVLGFIPIANFVTIYFLIKILREPIIENQDEDSSNDEG